MRWALSVCDDKNAVHFSPVFRHGRISAAALMLRLLRPLLRPLLLCPLCLLHLVLLLHLEIAQHKPDTVRNALSCLHSTARRSAATCVSQSRVLLSLKMTHLLVVGPLLRLVHLRSWLLALLAASTHLYK
jgi:hypothetical protein